MNGKESQSDHVLHRLAHFREDANLTVDEVEQQLLLGPGWINRFEQGLTVPPLDLLLVLLKKYGRQPAELFAGTDVNAQPDEIVRHVYAEASGPDLLVRFNYAKHDATYRLERATLDEFNAVIKVLRDGLARLSYVGDEKREAVKADSVASAFLHAARVWPHANPSDIWWFIISRAYFDPYNHPAEFARLDFGQSWKRTGGWALEKVLVQFYGPLLKSKRVEMFIASAEEKRELIQHFKVSVRIEADKIDVVLVGLKGKVRVPFGVVHVKASFAERRSDDVPMSEALVKAGYTSPLWTFDCKSTPADQPINRGELGVALSGSPDLRSAKRKDIEDDGYFSSCFSYNRRTVPTPTRQKVKGRVVLCDFSNPDDQFSKYVVSQWKAFSKR